MDKLSEIELLFQNNFGSMYKIATHIVKDKQVAKDIIQDVFYNFWKSQEKAGSDLQMKSYLIKSTVKFSLNYLKKRGTLDQKILFQNYSTDDCTSQSKKNLEINEAVMSLPPKCQSVFMMKEYGGMDHQDIAKTMGISIKSVEGQIGIAAKKLKNDLTHNLQVGLINAILSLLACSFFY